MLERVGKPIQSRKQRGIVDTHVVKPLLQAAAKLWIIVNNELYEHVLTRIASYNRREILLKARPQITLREESALLHSQPLV